MVRAWHPRLTGPPIRGWRTIFAGLLAAAASAVVAPGHGLAQELCAGGAPPLGRLVSIQGRVDVNRAPATLGLALCPGDRIAVGTESRAAVHLYEINTVLRLDERTRLDMPDAPPGERTFFDLLSGVLNLFSQTPKRFEVRSPFVDGGVEGTEFQMRVEVDESVGPVGATLRVFEGTVLASNEAGEARVASGEALYVNGRCEDGPESCIPLSAPVAGQLEVAFEDAVAWAVYYPPLVPDPEDPATPEALRRAAGLLAAGRIAAVDALLAEAPETAASLAVRAITALALNRRDQAQAFAERAVAEEAAPPAARTAALLALSYVRQARFALDDARDAVIAAAEVAPDNGLVQARLAELDLALGERRAARAAADRGVALAPDLARPRLIQGFAALAAIDTGAARAAFEAAMARDPNDPLAFLGLGLAIIRDGDLASGRAQIEIAVSLDPVNALVRSYLGKAYFEERRSPEDAVALAIAKRRDPNDPTPWFYDAIRLQTENRPVQALDALKTSIALNDNRAPYRSRLLLDEDKASRTTSLARIFDDLGFNQVGLEEGTRSLDFDPANHSAHRFLADSYGTQRRHEIARASEVLQSQLLQPINSTPVPPQNSEIDLDILARGGPASPSLDEFNQLFQRNDAQLTASVYAGNNGTFGDEAVISGIYDRAAINAGQFHYQSDGFRQNNDIDHDLYGVFAQVQLVEWLDAQVELRRRRSDQGDRTLNFDPDNFSIFDRNKVSKDVARIGLHASPAPHSDVLLSLLHAEREQRRHLQATPTDAIVDAFSKTNGFDFQGQYIYNSALLDVVAGGGTSLIDRRLTETTDLRPVLPAFVCAFVMPCLTSVGTPSTFDQDNGYLYGHIAWPDSVLWTVGVSYDALDTGSIDVHDLNPKVGVRWRIGNPLPFVDAIELRAAYFQTLKRVLIVDQTLEPTQVAGFNQFFDDTNGAETERFGIGLDVELSDDIYLGGEISRRNVDTPIVFSATGEVRTDDRREDLYRAYVNWTPTEDWALRIAYEFERFLRTEALAEAGALPFEVVTTSVPMGVRYFSPPEFVDGLFGEAELTVVHQEVGFPATVTFAEDTETFTVLDVGIGWRMPKRRGVLSFEVRNLLGSDFLFQDLDFYNSDTNTPRFVPDRTYLVRGTINF